MWCYNALDLLSCHNTDCKTLQCGNGIWPYFCPVPYSIRLGHESCWVWLCLLAEWSAWRHLGCSCSRGGLSLQRADFITNRLHTNPGKERCGGNVETGLTPFLFDLSQLILELATHCSGRAEVVGWCVCAHVLVLPCVGISSWEHLGSREGRKPWGNAATEWGFGRMWCTSGVTALGLCCVLARLEGGFHFLFLFHFHCYKVFYWFIKEDHKNVD